MKKFETKNLFNVILNVLAACFARNTLLFIYYRIKSAEIVLEVEEFFEKLKTFKKNFNFPRQWLIFIKNYAISKQFLKSWQKFEKIKNFTEFFDGCPFWQIFQLGQYLHLKTKSTNDGHLERTSGSRFASCWTDFPPSILAHLALNPLL